MTKMTPEMLRPTLDLGIGAYTLPVALEKIRRLSKALDDALAAWEADRKRADCLERLVIAAGAILGNGNPGSGWMDWEMRAQSVLGMAFVEGRWKNGNAMPYDEIKAMISDMPRVLAQDVKRATLAAEEEKP